LLTLVALVIFTTYQSDRFLSAENVTNILRQHAPVGIIALGMAIVIILGGIDLSVGSLVALAGGVGIWTMNTAYHASRVVARAVGEGAASYDADSAFRVWLAKQFSSFGFTDSVSACIYLGMAAVVLTGLAGGMLNGLLVAVGRIPPFIATLGTMAAFRSVALTMADGGEFRVDGALRSFRDIGAGGVPIPFVEVRPGVPLQIWYPIIIALALFLVVWVIHKRTRFGRYVVAIGCNEQAARYSAINITLVKLLSYSLLGLLTGIAALIQASRFSSVASSNSGLLFELDAIAAVVIGGTSMRGGLGTIPGTVIGVLMLGVVGNMLILLNVSPYLQGLVKGAIVIGAALLQRGRAHR
jgi:ribose transport system permease protein